MKHIPVMLRECIQGLNIRPEGIYCDCTLGRGGHSAEIAVRLTTGRLIAIDQDEQAILEAGKNLAPFGSRVTLVRGNFRELERIFSELSLPGADGFLFDLGVSSPQLDDAERGFSYMADAPLDMRMDRRRSLTAYDIVNQYSREELRRILFEYGEERYAPLIAAAVARQREKAPIETTGELVELIRRAVPAQALREKQHPAKRSFQALRIEVNDELGALSEALASAAGLLLPGGRLVVLSFQSLEDRIVKQAIREREHGCTCPPQFPVCVCGFRRTLRSVTKGAMQPRAEELEENPRARSARLRIAERTDA